MAIDVAGLKDHLQFEDGMDDSMLSFYLDMAKKFVKNATGNAEAQIVYHVAAIFWIYKVPETEMQNAFDALTPLILQEGLVKEDAENNAEQYEVES